MLNREREVYQNAKSEAINFKIELKRKKEAELEKQSKVPKKRVSFRSRIASMQTGVKRTVTFKSAADKIKYAKKKQHHENLKKEIKGIDTVLK